MCISNRTLKVDKFVTASVSYPHELVVRGGVIVSCLGLILGTMATAPNILWAMCLDDVLPFLTFLRSSGGGGGGMESGEVDGENEETRGGADSATTGTRALWFTCFLVA